MKPSKSERQTMLSGISIAHAIKTKMGTDYHGLFPPHFALGLSALLSCLLSSFVLLLLFSFTWFEFSTLVMLADTALMFVLMSLLLRLIQGRASLGGIKLTQAYAVCCAVAGALWLVVVYNQYSPSLLTALAWIGIVAGVIGAVLFSTQRFKQLVQYQQKVWHIRQEVLAEMKKSSAS
ncbi:MULTISPECIES: hypothetical protein [unclassified Arsukibacterium]|uniref:hypothetical protein n=1 Tax=unclassified Arsukibacterium TaxID=2635278 RepID=UPI000C4F638A|nr:MULTISPECIES: hypothetical protein [unclassified Arsukibacterium]MAA95715.1 hypothetical protein [Rheinheimera sp.]MBM35354.1 hypothetical protein [Rheinheimera sp.]HAW92072.1 hypothetical protein [Candidatus Azambacteria bacterium]|tara:strand:+ start:1601 stop:2134 length:534 start_codon:yes stop_codon:yes gene_type:complete